jgi:enoyl-CoA hydratase/carnithine racemase
MEACVTVEQRGAVRMLTLSHEARRNALNRALVADLRRRLDETAALSDVSVVILRGAGRAAFCAGADLRERATMNEDEARAFLGELRALMNAVEDLPQPVVAALGGVALGGGLELALCCDIRLAARSAVLGLPEVRLGIIPGAGGTQRLTRAVGPQRAALWLLQAARLSAEEALQGGLVAEVVEDDQLEPRAWALAQTIAEAAPLSLRAARRAMQAGWRLERDACLDAEAAAYAPLLLTEDRTEALRAFAEKRPPVFQGR